MAREYANRNTDILSCISPDVVKRWRTEVSARSQFPKNKGEVYDGNRNVVVYSDPRLIMTFEEEFCREFLSSVNEWM